MVQEVIRFLKVDTNFMNIRPLRYSLVLDPHPDTLQHVAPSITKRYLKLQDALLSSFHQNEVKYFRISFLKMKKNIEGKSNGCEKYYKNRSEFILCS